MKKRIVGRKAFTQTEVTTYEGVEFQEARKENPLLGTLEEKLVTCERLAERVIDDPKIDKTEIPQYLPIFVLNHIPYSKCPLSQECSYSEGCKGSPCRYPRSNDLLICHDRNSYIKHIHSTDKQADSAKMLAVGLLDLIKFIRSKFQENNINAACTASFALGVKYQQLKTVLLHSSKTSRNAGKKRGDKGWKQLAGYLVDEYPKKTNMERINKIPETTYLEVGGFEFSLEGGVTIVCARYDGKEFSITKGSFEKGYLVNQ